MWVFLVHSLPALEVHVRSTGLLSDKREGPINMDWWFWDVDYPAWREHMRSATDHPVWLLGCDFPRGEAF